MRGFSLSRAFHSAIKVLMILCSVAIPNQMWAKKVTWTLPSEISTTINLQGDTLYLQKGATVRFHGGKIINGTVVFNENRIIEPDFENVRFAGIVADSYFNIRDFGAKPAMEIDCSDIINDIVKLKVIPDNNNNPKHIYIPKGVYYIDKPIELFAGWNSPITICGEGRMSIICQRTDNENIIHFFEQNHIKDLMLTYKNQQSVTQTNSIAIACQRAIYSLFENVIISKANTAFGYMSLKSQKTGYNPTGYRDQCYVSCNFRNIRIYETSGYAFDFRKEFAQGDSGSAYDNIYISCNDINGKAPNKVSKGAIRGDNTVACITQLNIEGANYTEPLINLGGMSRVSVESLHLEGVKNMPSIAKVQVQSVASFNIVDIQACEFLSARYNAFDIKDSGLVNIKILTLRQDCKKAKGYKQSALTNNVQHLKIEQKLDAINLF